MPTLRVTVYNYGPWFVINGLKVIYVATLTASIMRTKTIPYNVVSLEYKTFINIIN
jgi:hypothetical protein